MEEILKNLFYLIKNFNNNYANAASFFLALIATIIAGYFYGIYKESQLKQGDASSIISNVFYGLNKKCKILAVHEYIRSNSASGYNHIAQNSRPDQYLKLIKIEKSFLNFKYKILPIDSTKILTVIISRNGKEKWKSIHFNQ
jgi:hypothetical protein